LKQIKDASSHPHVVVSRCFFRPLKIF